jgi:hypothetical protein
MAYSFILIVVLAGLFSSLAVSSYSQAVGSSRLDLQADVRRTLDWTTKDIRQAISWDICNNSPSATYIKFHLWTWDQTTHTFSLTNELIEYEYDANARTLTRRLVDSGGTVLESWVFYNISAPPFYTAYISPSDNEFKTGDLLTNKKLIVVITAQKNVRVSTDIRYSLKEEVRIRNG